MPAIPKSYISEKTYLEEERKSTHKSEYYKGEIFAMAGAGRSHNKITASLIVALGNYLSKKECAIFPSDLRVYNRENLLYTYPDITIVCGKEEYLDEEFDTLLNPTILIEVLSPSTEDYDRGTKFKLYRSIPSLQNYLLVSSTEYAAEIYTRKENNDWVLQTAKEVESQVYISAIDCTLSLRDIYAQVQDLLPG
jgi:Uma2 family endonuclease